MQRSRYRLKLGLLLVAVLLAVSFACFAKIDTSHAQTATGTSTTSNNTTTVLNPQALTASKALARSNTFLQWAFDLYKKNGGGSTEDLSTGTLYNLWKKSFQASLAVYLVFGVIIAFGFIIKASWITKWRRFIPWFFISIAGAAVSYFALNLVMHWIAALISAFLQSGNNGNLTVDKLISITGTYATGTEGGLTNASVETLEIVNNTITLIKITTATVYAIAIVLLLRIIVLWMLTVVVPFVFPFIAFPITQSIGRVWIREFVRWLIAGPLIALLLYASSQIITNFTFSGSSTSSYQGATQFGITSSSSTSSIATKGIDSTGIDSNTYARYILSLILLWASITLPWLLMRFAINHIETTSSKWYEKNREGAIFKQLANTFSRAGSGGEKRETDRQPDTAKFFAAKRLNLPARDIHIAPVVGGRGNAFNTGATPDTGRPISPIGALKLAGLTQLGETIEKIKTGRDKGLPLATLTALEQRSAGTINEVLGEINQLQNPDAAKDPLTRQRIHDLKNNLIINESRASLEAKGIIAAARQDTRNITNQNIKSELREKTLETIKEKIRDTSTSVEKSQDLQQIGKLVDQYQSTPQAKQVDREELGRQIEKLAKTVVAESRKDNAQYPTRQDKHQVAPATTEDGKREDAKEQGNDGSFNMPSGGLSSMQLPKSHNPEDQLLNSLEFLSGALSYTSDDDIGKVFEEKPEMAAKMTDQSGRKDYEETKKQWVEYYRNTTVPISATIKTRADWLKAQIAMHQDILGKVTSKDYDERNKGIETLSKQAPFLVLGNYSILEIASYLRAKTDAAQAVLGEQKDVSSPPSTPSDSGIVNTDNATSQNQSRSQNGPALP